ncbi:transcriptional regulator [Veronia nyctiphanis]|uniref:Transcriptional regulator n=1 Tax=Veronia nyctiphanis TaxID=1278244 RepID=A0A4Q0YMH4_9GAMM|nr:transcriptional regulator [Veronia nyctiphanis]RXJ72040.1 transcriptional regulator [Veronia nyctiphanis]RXJ72055.1 transcriptional regulator [Veronia nyctiphanis]
MNFFDIQKKDVVLADRMAYIDFKLRFTGSINRSDLNEIFGLAEAAASKMMTKYQEFKPGNMTYDRAKRANTIVQKKFSPLIDVDAETALGMLANGFNRNKLGGKPMLPYQRLGKIEKQLDTESVAKITRAITTGNAITTVYLSENSDMHGRRELFPLAIVYDGNHWIFRAYEASGNKALKFKNYAFSRATKVIEKHDNKRDVTQTLGADTEWNTQVPLVLVPHPDRTPKEVDRIKADFGFKDQSKLIITEKVALLWMINKQWSIDDRSDEQIKKDNNEIEKGLKKSPYYNFKLENKEMLDIVIANLK